MPLLSPSYPGITLFLSTPSPRRSFAPPHRLFSLHTSPCSAPLAFSLRIAPRLLASRSSSRAQCLYPSFPPPLYVVHVSPDDSPCCSCLSSQARFLPAASLTRLVVQLWDLRTCALMQDIEWQNFQQDPCMLYAAQFSKDPQARHIVAGGSGMNEARLFERATGKVVGSLRGMKQGVYSVDFHPTTSQVAVSSGDGTIRLVNYGR
mmetsp:Transcript_12798/g.35470  ORF Transcript_12798/g.35470 Transcript_12798/m.35470 type:complete len:205 (-) Transcript_12798:294-908(-)